MKEWWDSLQSRERYIVFIGIGILTLIVLYFMLWMPIHKTLDEKKMRVEAKQETVVWMAQKKQEVEHLKRLNPNLFNQATDNRSLLAIVDTGAKQMGVREAIKRIEPKGEDKVQLWLEEIVFNRLIVLLGELNRRNHIRIADVSLNKAELGKVSGNITLNK